jgi:hypothetical protein
MSDFPDWQNPVGIADEIALTGVGLLRFEQAVGSGTTSALAAGASTTVGPFVLNSTSYELVLTLTASALTALCDGQITLKWSDKPSSALLAQKTFSMVASTGGHKCSVEGPIRGGSLSVTFTNSSTSLANVTFGYTVVASSRLAPNDLMRTLTGVGSGPPTVATWSGVNMDSGILGNANPSIGGGAVAIRGLGAYNGPVQLAVSTASGTNDCLVEVAALDTGIVVNYGRILSQLTDAKGKLNIQFNMPMAQCTIQLNNNNVGAQNIGFVVTTAEPNVN